MTKKNTNIKIILSIIVILNISLFTALQTEPGLKRAQKRLLYQIKNALAQNIDASVRLDVPYHRQEHSLSCEIAVLKMALNYYGVSVSENDLLEKLPFDTQNPRSKDNIWGDPNLGFVGNIDGTIPNEGYGVYEKPIADLSLDFNRLAEIRTGETLKEILQEVKQGRPVIVWGTLSSGKDISWKTKEGINVKAIYGEHTRVIIGYEGAIDSPKSIILHDPVYGTITMTKKKFLSDWGLLGNKAVVVY